MQNYEAGLSYDDAGEIQINNPLYGFLGYQLKRASNAMITDLSQRLLPLELTPIKGTVMLIISFNPGITQVRISKMLAIKRANLAPIIGSFEERGIISRKPVDGRSQGLMLTDSGSELMTTAKQVMEDHESQFKSLLSEETLDYFLRDLPKLWDDTEFAGVVDRDKESAAIGSSHVA